MLSLSLSVCVYLQLTANVVATVHVTYDNGNYKETPVSGTGDTRTVTVHHAFQTVGSHAIHVTVYQEDDVDLPAGSASLSVDVRGEGRVWEREGLGCECVTVGTLAMVVLFLHAEAFHSLHVGLPNFTPTTCDLSGKWTDLLGASILFEYHASKGNTPAASFGTVMYTVDFGDGQRVTSPSMVQYHSYNQTGSFTVNITGDNIVSQASCSWTITIVQGKVRGGKCEK